MQIANELAAQLLCHPLIPTPHADGPLYVKAFLYRLEQAVTLMWGTNPDSLLCIVIDAADNAQMVAEESGETRSFARDLLREKIPAGVRLVFLCRSHRQAMLDPPTNALRLELRRVCFGIEIDPLFVDVAIRRWQAFAGEKAKRASDGRSISGELAPRGPAPLSFRDFFLAQQDFRHDTCERPGSPNWWQDKTIVLSDP